MKKALAAALLLGATLAGAAVRTFGKITAKKTRSK